MTIIVQPKQIELDFNQYLQPCSWRGLSFPIAIAGEKGEQKLAIHQKMDRDGAQVESTGRGPDLFSVRGYFFNDLFVGPNETWGNAQLFPNVWLLVRDALRDRSTGVFNHPLYGPINCKSASWNMEVDAEKRRGVIVTMDFIETIDADGQAVSTPSVSGQASSAASGLDGSLSGISSLTPNLGGFGSFSSWVSSITSAFNSIVSIGNSVVNSINRLIGSLNSLISQTNSILDLSGLTNTDASNYLDVIDSTNRLLEQLYIMRQQLNAKAADTAVLITNAPTTIASIMISTQNKLEDLLNLNPGLASTPFVSLGTTVTYYVQ